MRCVGCRETGGGKLSLVSEDAAVNDGIESVHSCDQPAAETAENDSSYESSYSILSESDVSSDNVVSAETDRSTSSRRLRWTSLQCMCRSSTTTLCFTVYYT